MIGVKNVPHEFFRSWNTLGSCVGICLGNCHYPLHPNPLYLQKAQTFYLRGAGLRKMNQYTTDLLPEGAVPPEIARKGLYKAAGYSCRDCNFTTKKKGFPGRQSLRAHMKKHKNEKRAWLYPLIRQLAMVMVLGAVTVLGWFEQGHTDFVPEIPFKLPLVIIPSNAIWPIVGLIGLSVLVSLYVVVIAESDSKALIRVISGCNLLGVGAGVLSLALVWGGLDAEFEWPIHLAVWTFIALTPILAAKRGVVRLSVRRRRQKSNAYVPVVQPKSEDAKMMADRDWERRAAVVGKPQICPGCKGRFPSDTPPGEGVCNRCGTAFEFKAEIVAEV